MAYFDLNNLNLAYTKVMKASNPKCNGADVIKWHWVPPASKM